jgi:methylglutaconyl-CoA hydratase
LSVFAVCDLVRTTPHPTLALVQGGCIGGALALASCCDILIAAKNAFFSIPEVRLGFAPGTSSGPMFARAIGVRNFRRYGMTGQRFGADEALRMGLAHQLCEPQDLERALDAQLEELLLAAPAAARKAKLMAEQLAGPLPSLEEIEALFANPLETAESIEGHRSFLEKRKPNWYPKA